MRVKLNKENLKKLFCVIRERIGTWSAASRMFGVHTRTLSDWRRGAASMDRDVFKRIVAAAKFSEAKFSPKILDDHWHLREAGRRGGRRRQELYGNLGTPEGRRRGGLHSLRTHRLQKTGFQLLKPIQVPRKSVKLAELMGALIGDGHLSEYQVLLTTHSKTDRAYANFFSGMLESLFGMKPSIKKKKGENAVNVLVSSRNLVYFLNRCGMPIGNKIGNGVAAPKWIFRKDGYKRAFIRGLFDTDGCVYLDKHRINGKKYYNLGWTITSYSDTLMKDILRLLVELGFSPTKRPTQKSAYLRKRKEIDRYFKEISTSNEKHLKRLRSFIGGVPKRS